MFIAIGCDKSDKSSSGRDGHGRKGQVPVYLQAPHVFASVSNHHGNRSTDNLRTSNTIKLCILHVRHVLMGVYIACVCVCSVAYTCPVARTCTYIFLTLLSMME